MDSMGKLSKINTLHQTGPKPKQYHDAPQFGASQLEAMKNVESLLADTDLRILQGNMNQLKNDATYKKIDRLLSTVQLGEKPLTKILNTIAKGNYNVLKAMLPDMINGYTSDNFREDNPVLYAIADLIFPTLFDMFDIGINAGLSDEGEINLQNGEFGYANFSNVALGMVETLLGMVNSDELVTLVRKSDISEPSKKEKIANFYEKIEQESGDNFIDAEDFDQSDPEVAQVFDAYMNRTKDSSSHNAKYYTDMLSGAKSSAKNKATRYYQKSVTKVGQGYVGIGMGVYGAMERIGKGGDWRNELKAILDPNAISNRAITGKNTTGIDSEAKFDTVSGGVWENAQEKLKEAMNGSD